MSSYFYRYSIFYPIYSENFRPLYTHVTNTVYDWLHDWLHHTISWCSLVIISPCTTKLCTSSSSLDIVHKLTHGLRKSYTKWNELFIVYSCHEWRKVLFVCVPNYVPSKLKMQSDCICCCYTVFKSIESSYSDSVYLSKSSSICSAPRCILIAEKIAIKEGTLLVDNTGHEKSDRDSWDKLMDLLCSACIALAWQFCSAMCPCPG